MTTKMCSTRTKLKQVHVQQVRDILDSYEVRGLRVSISEQGASWVLQIEDDHDEEWEPAWGADDDPEHWKRAKALKRHRLRHKEQFGDEQAWTEALDEVFSKEGWKGFRALLGELADHLETPLVVLELDRDPDALGQASAEALVVQPGHADVESVTVVL